MFKTILTALIAWPAFAGAALALSIPPANCIDPDGTEYWEAFRYYSQDLVTVTISSRDMWEQELEQVALVSCSSQKQVVATVSSSDLSAYRVTNIFGALINDTVSHTFADTVLHLAEAGYDARIGFFNNNACLCGAYVLKEMNSLDRIEDNQ